MNSDQFQSMIRQLLTVGSSVAVTIGHADPTRVDTIAGGVGVLISVMWSLFAHR